MTAFTFAHAVYDCITAIYGFRQDWAREQPLCAFTGYVLVISAAGTHHAHLVEALSRLFFTVFFKRKFLQTYRVHWCLIIGNWLFTTLAPILPFFYEYGYSYEEESRLCYPTTKQFTTSMYLIVVGYVTPLSLTLVIYFIIWHTARMSLRRTMNRDENNGTRLMPHAKREMKLARNLLIAQAPIFLSVARETTFINSIDVIRKLEKDVEDGHFRPTTKFVTMDVTDLYTMIPRQGTLEALVGFCMKHSKNNRIGTLYIDHIMKIARLILDTNYFAYYDKYYKQIRGGAMGSAFTQVLANIYMYEWEQDLIKYQKSKNEIYGRYIDDILMTTNEPEHKICQILDKENNKNVNIKINYQIGISVDFLDVTIQNVNNRLRTVLYHKLAAEPYILPFTSEHPRHILRNIPCTAILRAAKICSDVNDFNVEQHNIMTSLLLNGYPPKCIDKCFQHFFKLNAATSVLTDLNERTYQHLHQKLLRQPTRREKQLNVRLIDLIEAPTVLQSKIWDKSIMYSRYPYNFTVLAVYPNNFTIGGNKILLNITTN
ncbi:unnamed protein product [Rotaria magnacalcarata]|uniref:Uncharacterized protein n=1 Tax=Rotaria magnacalcarata TaxID=392030 RepID=A0A820CH53_9BILA|nr:unnamed protein product [Rotaria magnacalcarata]CAF4213607.1 unnamed protein product [Rotaria magnacalcarata]